MRCPRDGREFSVWNKGDGGGLYVRKRWSFVYVFFMEEGISAGLEFHFDMSFVVINFLSNFKGFDW